MSSLWTPGGEHRIPRSPADQPEDPTGPPGGSGGSGGPGRPGRSAPAAGPDGGTDDGELEQQMEQLTEQLLNTPAADVIANHCYGMFELAALHLGARPPKLAEARVAIDAFAAVVEALGPRLGQAAPTLREGLSNIKMAYVQIAAVSGEGDPAASPQA